MLIFRVGFPEVNLGILPGAGGTQRLSRLTGLPVAMEMIYSGRHVAVKKAKEYGIIDEVSWKFFYKKLVKDIKSSIRFCSI
jgi:enoyl-CoA hydratase/carnithine racemase